MKNLINFIEKNFQVNVDQTLKDKNGSGTKNSGKVTENPKEKLVNEEGMRHESLQCHLSATEHLEI